MLSGPWRWPAGALPLLQGNDVVVMRVNPAVLSVTDLPARSGKRVMTAIVGVHGSATTFPPASRPKR